MGLSLQINEKQLLRCLLEMPELSYKIEKNYFTTQFGSVLFESIKSLYGKGLELSNNHILVESGDSCEEMTEGNLEILRKQDFSLEAFEIQYLPRLRKDWAKSKIGSIVLEDLSRLTMNRGELKVDELREALLKIEDCMNLVDGKKKHLISTSEMFDMYQRELSDRERMGGIYTTGSAYLDKFLSSGFAPGQMTTIFGASGVGKSTLALNLVNRQLNRGLPSLYVTLELNSNAVMDRLICMRRDLTMEHLYPDELGFISSATRDVVEKERNKLKNNKNFYIVETPSISILDLKAIIRETMLKMKCTYMIVTLDLMTMLIDFSGEDAASYEDAMNRLHILAREENVHFVNVVQANRGTDARNVTTIDRIRDFRPAPNHIKNSNAILERSRIVISVFRPKYYASRLFPEDPELFIMADELEAQILKQNQGEVGKIAKFLFSSNFNLRPIV